MEKTACTLLFVKGVRRTAVRWAGAVAMLGCVAVGCAKESSSG